MLPGLQRFLSQDLEKLHDLRQKARKLMDLVVREKGEGLRRPSVDRDSFLPDDLLHPAKRDAVLREKLFPLQTGKLPGSLE